MSEIRDKLTNMFSKVMAGTVTREEGTMLINHLAKGDPAETVKELVYLIDNPPSGVFPKTILHTISLARNKAFNNILIGSLEHRSEDVSIMAAQELANLKTSDAKKMLLEHLSSEVYHVRRASAQAILSGFADGVAALKKHLIEHPEPFSRSTAAFALLKAGRAGMEALIEAVNSGNVEVVASASEALSTSVDGLTEADIPKIFEALMQAGDMKNDALVIEILKLAATLKKKARGFETYVMVFSDHPEEAVKSEAEKTLAAIR